MEAKILGAEFSKTKKVVAKFYWLNFKNEISVGATAVSNF